MKGKLTNSAAEDRARAIADLRARGKTNREIADALGLRIWTVNFYLSGRCKAAWHAGIFTADRPAASPPWSNVTQADP